MKHYQLHRSDSPSPKKNGDPAQTENELVKHSAAITSLYILTFVALFLMVSSILGSLCKIFLKPPSFLLQIMKEAHLWEGNNNKAYLCLVLSSLFVFPVFSLMMHFMCLRSPSKQLEDIINAEKYKNWFFIYFVAFIFIITVILGIIVFSDRTIL